MVSETPKLLPRSALKRRDRNADIAAENYLQTTRQNARIAVKKCSLRCDGVHGNIAMVFGWVGKGWTLRCFFFFTMRGDVSYFFQDSRA